MDIKEKITELLQKDKHTFRELADYVRMSESDLTQQLNNRTLELRKLETISKVLRVPLYSFFRTEELYHLDEKPFYINRLWTGDDGSKTIAQLTHEISLLKQIIALKEDSLSKLKGKS